MISVELDLSNKIEDNIRKCLIKRYIINFVKDVSGNLTPLGQAALDSFQIFLGNPNIIISEFENWHTNIRYNKSFKS
jgi:hypothetical protein